MTTDLPEQRPEAKLIEEAAAKDSRSIRQLAPLAGMSDGRWRQITKGYQRVSGNVVEVIAPANTLARMASVLGVSAGALERAGRRDAAAALDALDAQGDDRTLLQKMSQAARLRPEGQAPDEIDLIFESSMNARQKLEMIRKVLTLRAQAEKEEAAEQTATSHEPVNNGR